MNASAQPFVSVLTPVYNGETYLAECIESVLAQEYENWEYVILNNCSTDNTLRIARHYAERDQRVRIFENKTFLPVMRNLNHAFRQISKNSAYCKVVHADDWIFPNCLAQMVAIAEANQSVGLVGSYMLQGTRVVCDRLPYPTSVISGRKICREDLLAGPGTSIFGGSPTALLIRSDLIRDNRNGFYNEAHLYGDREACYEQLQRCDFGFVHQVLSGVRDHDGQQSSFIRRVNGYIASKLYMATKFGPIYLNQQELDKLINRKLKEYDRFLAKNLLCGRNKEFWEFHRTELRKVGYPLRLHKLCVIACAEILKLLLNPERAGETFLKRFGGEYAR
ncbi:glycosyltransferase [bacterium]|nr:glycosyltransferase [bacterium]